MISLEQAIEIFEKYEIKAAKDNKGALVISHYCQPKGKTFKELGINEDELIANVAVCEGRFETKNSALTTFPLVVCRELRLDEETNITELPNLKMVGTFLVNKKLKKAPKLKSVASASFDESVLKALPKLKEAGILVFQNSKIENLASLQRVGKLCIIDCPVEELKNLEYGQDIFICSTDENNKAPIISLPSLNEVENLFVANANLKSLPKLKTAKKVALYNCAIKSFKGAKGANIEIANHISDDELNDKFDTFTDWYNSDLFESSLQLLGGVAASV